MNFLFEFIKFLSIRKKYWLLPIILVLATFGMIIIMSQGTVIAPFAFTSRDPEPYNKFHAVVLTHSCRQNSELGYGKTLIDDILNLTNYFWTLLDLNF